MKPSTKAISLLTVLSVLAAVLIGRGMRSSMRAEYERGLNQWIAEGLAMSLRDMQPPAPPDEENAALLYKRAIAMLDRLSDEERDSLGDPTGEYPASTYRNERLIEGDSLRAEAVELNRAAVAKLAPALELARQAAAMPDCFWGEVHDGDDYGQSLLRFIELRELSRALSDRAYHAANDGMLEEAVHDLAAIAAMADHVGSHPVLHSQLIRMSLLRHFLSTVETSFRDLDREVPEHLEAIIAAMEFRAEMSRALEVEAHYAIGHMDRMSFETIESFVGLDISLGLLLRAWWYRDREKAYILECYRELIGLIKAPPQNRVQPFVGADFPSYAILSPHFLNSLSMIERLILREERGRLLALLALDLRRYRNVHGGYPETWEMPLDPLSGQPISYERSETGGFRLFTVDDAVTPAWEWD